MTLHIDEASSWIFQLFRLGERLRHCNRRWAEVELTVVTTIGRRKREEIFLSVRGMWWASSAMLWWLQDQTDNRCEEAIVARVQYGEQLSRWSLQWLAAQSYRNWVDSHDDALPFLKLDHKTISPTSHHSKGKSSNNNANQKSETCKKADQKSHWQ